MIFWVQWWQVFLISWCVQFCVLIPKYTNFATVSTDLSATLILCPSLVTSHKARQHFFFRTIYCQTNLHPSNYYLLIQYIRPYHPPPPPPNGRMQWLHVSYIYIYIEYFNPYIKWKMYCFAHKTTCFSFANDRLPKTPVLWETQL